VRFLVDAQLPPALARWLADQGQLAEHVVDLGLGTASDSQIWAHALAIGAVIVTKDDDFARRRAVASTGPQIVWLRVGNSRTHVLLKWFGSVFPQILLLLEQGEVLIEVR